MSMIQQKYTEFFFFLHIKPNNNPSVFFLPLKFSSQKKRLDKYFAIFSIAENKHLFKFKKNEKKFKIPHIKCRD